MQQQVQKQILHCVQDDKQGQGQKQQQIPFGMTAKKSKGKS
jgi:hypothetical protein